MSQLCSIRHNIPVLGTWYGIWWSWYGQFEVRWIPLQLWLKLVIELKHAKIGWFEFILKQSKHIVYEYIISYIAKKKSCDCTKGEISMENSVAHRLSFVIYLAFIPCCHAWGIPLPHCQVLLIAYIHIYRTAHFNHVTRMLVYKHHCSAGS